MPGTEVGFNSEANGVHGQSGTTFVDASVRWKINEHFELSLEGNNLTNEAQESWVANPAVQLPLEYSQTGRQYLLGFATSSDAMAGTGLSTRPGRRQELAKEKPGASRAFLWLFL